MTWPPAASMRSAAAITSITMNGGTSLRREAIFRSSRWSLTVASRIDICYFGFQPGRAPRYPRGCPRQAAFGGLLGHSRYRACRQLPKTKSPTPINKSASSEDPRMQFRRALKKKMSGLVAATVAVAVAGAPVAPAFAQENKGPSTLRDTESEQLLRDYTRPILRAAGLEKQNINVVIINDSSFNAFVADGHRIFVNYGAIMQSETPNQLIGVLAHETGHLAGGHL